MKASYTPEVIERSVRDLEHWHGRKTDDLGMCGAGVREVGCVGPKVRRETTATGRALGRARHGSPLGPGHSSSRDPLGDLTWPLPCSLQEGGTRKML